MRPARDVSSLPLTPSRAHKKSRNDDVVPTAWNHGARAAGQCCQRGGIVLSFALVMRYLGSLTVWTEIFPWATDTLDMITLVPTPPPAVRPRRPRTGRSGQAGGPGPHTS